MPENEPLDDLLEIGRSQYGGYYNRSWKPKITRDPDVCRKCGGQRARLSRARILMAAAALAVVGLTIALLTFSIVVVLPTAYFCYILCLWGTVGKGRWCPKCKRI